MSRRIANLAFAAALGLVVTVWLSGAAQAGPASVCGNSVIEAPETCDDGNTVSGDGCSGISCKAEVCGDNILNTDPAPGPAEECDDGNTVADDGCDATCKLECGNGTIQGAETCDDSGESATCDDDCTAVSCGDSNVNETAGEECDPPGATCSDTCQITGEPPTKGQQGCVNAVNANGLGVLKALDKAFAKCLKDIAAGKADLTCFATVDTSKAEGKTASTISGKKCTGANLPIFAFTDATTVNTAAKNAGLGSATTVFGAVPAIASKSTDKEGAACQAEASKRVAKLQETWLAEANKIKKSALKGGAKSDAELATAITTGIAGNAKITKAEGGVNSGVAKKCPDARVDELFDCGGATTGNGLALCGIAAAERAGCLAIEGADGLSLDCPGDL